MLVLQVTLPGGGIANRSAEPPGEVLMLVLLDDADCPVARPARPWNRLMARMRASRLDSDLADGASPDATVALALRAQLLVRARTRRDVAEDARRVLATAMRAPAAGRWLTPAARGPQMPAAGRLRVPICRDRVRESSEEFMDLIWRLLADAPVAARGVALASVLLSDGRGPLYHRGNADDVRARVREAVNALDPLTS
jgi:hypothetical protein